MTVSEAHTRFAKLLGIIGNGAEVELVQDHQPMAKVVSLRRSYNTSQAGSVWEEGDLVSPTGVSWEAAS